MSAHGSTKGSASSAPAIQPPTRVVGIGASAGGLDTLQELLGPLSPGTGAMFIVAQHLSPDHPSLIVELLAREARLPVVAAVDGMPLQADVIVIGPPSRDIAVEGDRIALVEPDARFTPSPSVDVLFDSLALNWGERAVAVILSGTGSDGAHGMRAVRGAGGLTMVQDPAGARFDGMPRAAIALGGAELVGTCAELAARLAHPSAEHPLGELPTVEVDAPDMLVTITAHLRRAVGIDFSRFKESTLRRQIRRRMAVRQVSDVDDYFALLAEDTDEAHALCANLLVTVTSFFRDPEAFEALRAQLRDYVEREAAREQLRVWVPGCATGEEVYTIAMIVSDILGHPSDLSRRLKIFGTDLDDTSLAIARRAHYSITAATQIPADYRDRFISAAADGFQVAEILRECTVFSHHDVGEDPPFPRLDLISCRNTLIYFTTPLQQRVLQLFSYALQPGALLFLGRTEGLDQAASCFDLVDAERRIFVRNHKQVSRPDLSEPGRSGRSLRTPVVQPRVTVVRDSALESHTDLLESLVRSVAPASLVLDQGHNLVEVVGDVSPYCRVPEGQLTSAVGSFLRPELQDEARALFLLSRADGQPVEGQSYALDGVAHRVRLRVAPLDVGGRPLSILSFLPVDEPAELPARDRGVVFDREISRLERELLASQEAMRRSLSELQAANEELEASSEELQAASEELQAANEELEASNEELQATNEEIGSVNQELKAKSDQLHRVNTDLENVQASLSQGMVIVDLDHHVTRFTPLSVRVFALVDSDIGTSLAKVPTTLAITGLDEAIDAVIDGESRRSIEIGDGTVAYLIQVLPYLDEERRRCGAIITLTDVTTIVSLRTLAEEALAQVEAKSALLQKQATYDSLTGLLNRGSFHESLARDIARAQRSGKRLALVVVDLDRFKEANDEHGHEAGDMVLRATADRITGSVRGADIVGRVGGDEFAVIVDDFAEQGDLEMILDRVIESLRVPIAMREWELRVSGSVGVAIFPEDEETPDGLMRAADAAMYAAKKDGGDSYAYFDASLNEASDSRRKMRKDIDDALAQSQFTLHYQPVVSASDDQVWGVEALLRWNRDGEIVPAEDFIPFCQESGQIRALALVTLGLLRADLGQLWTSGHEGLKASFNLSATQLEDPHLADLINSWPTPGGLEGIVVEVLESVFLPEHGRALDLLATLRSLGAQISIDDYGSGYSNFHLLDRLAPAYIKLDRTFLNFRAIAQAQEALIMSAVEMSHVFGARVIAEGIESAAERDLMTRLGVEYLQGYAIAHPMALTELLAWLDARA